MSTLLRLERKQKNSSNPFRIRIFLFLSFSIGVKRIRLYTPVVRSKTVPDSRPKWVKSVSVQFSDQNGAKTLPKGGGGVKANTYIAYIRDILDPSAYEFGRVWE